MQYLADVYGFLVGEPAGAVAAFNLALNVFGRGAERVEARNMARTLEVNRELLGRMPGRPEWEDEASSLVRHLHHRDLRLFNPVRVDGAIDDAVVEWARGSHPERTLRVVCPCFC